MDQFYGRYSYSFARQTTKFYGPTSRFYARETFGIPHRKTYCTWILDFIRFHKRKHSESMGPLEVDAWLSYLANNRNVAINTQKTALNAVVFLYKQFF